MSPSRLRSGTQQEAAAGGGQTLAVIGAASVLASLDLFVVNLAFPSIARSFPGTTDQGLSWVLNAYGIVFAALLVPAGRLADRFGRRRVFRIGFAIFTLGSVVSPAAPDVVTLVIGIQARSRALLSDGQAAEALYREAIERLTRSRIAVHLARAHLLYGEWLRREKRRLEAREQLRTAHEMFSHIGAAAFAERARRGAAGRRETARKRTAGTSGELTAQEAQIVRLARDGPSNPEIGARLFISPRTVQHHLRKVLTKLAISSRSQLGRVLPADPDTVPPR
jgi:DNA-binding CsgD family transcriptional regulator